MSVRNLDDVVVAYGRKGCASNIVRYIDRLTSARPTTVKFT